MLLILVVYVRLFQSKFFLNMLIWKWLEVKLCRQCGRLWHTDKYCEGGKRCLRCGIRGTCSCSTIKCILCNSDKHTAVQTNDCPRWQEELEVKKIMILKKLPWRKVLKVYSTNSFDLLEDCDGNFPEISPRDNINNVDAEINNVPHVLRMCSQ